MFTLFLIFVATFAVSDALADVDEYEPCPRLKQCYSDTIEDVHLSKLMKEEPSREACQKYTESKTCYDVQKLNCTNQNSLSKFNKHSEKFKYFCSAEGRAAVVAKENSPCTGKNKLQEQIQEMRNCVPTSDDKDLTGKPALCRLNEITSNCVLDAISRLCGQNYALALNKTLQVSIDSECD